MKRPPVSGCLWIADNLLVRVRKAAKLPLSQTLLKGAFNSGVAFAVNLLSKEEFLAAGADALFGPVADVLDGQSVRQRREQPKVSMAYIFWADAGLLPTARQVREAIDSVEDAHALGLRVLLNGVGFPARAALVACCFQARAGHDGELAGERLGCLDGVNGEVADRPASLRLSAEERAFVAAWPPGSGGQPSLADMAWSDRDETFPLATVGYWLGVLPNVRVYTTARGRGCFTKVPVLDGQRVSDGADIDLDMEELRRGTWIGERTLRLPNGWQVVFVSSRR